MSNSTTQLHKLFSFKMALPNRFAPACEYRKVGRLTNRRSKSAIREHGVKRSDLEAHQINHSNL